MPGIGLRRRRFGSPDGGGAIKQRHGNQRMAAHTGGPTTIEPQWLDPEQQRAWRAYMEGSQRLLADLNRQLQRDCDLSLAEYRILVKLSESTRHALRMSDLADGVLSSRSRLTHQIRRMETQRLVRRIAAEGDGRGVVAEITEEGLRRLRAAAPGHVAAVRRYFVDLLSPQQLTAVGAAFDLVNLAGYRRAADRSSPDPD